MRTQPGDLFHIPAHNLETRPPLSRSFDHALDVPHPLGQIHLFMAGPGAFAFYLGQRQHALGPTILYEFDFEGTQGGSYERALSLPVCS